MKSIVANSKDYGFYSEFKRKSLKSFEQKRHHLI